MLRFAIETVFVTAFYAGLFTWTPLGDVIGWDWRLPRRWAGLTALCAVAVGLDWLLFGAP